MKIGILGSAPSLPLAPLSDPAWKFFGCSPGVYPFVDMSTLRAWFELHRWEPGIVGKAATQKPWFTPEYVQWMKQLPPYVSLWMNDAHRDVPNAKRLPIEDIMKKYGTYFLTSSVSIMLVCAIDDIIEDRKTRTAPQDDTIGLWGVDMAAAEEYGYQRAGCQYFIQLASQLGIGVYVPPESDLLRPMPIYGFDENSWWHIKNTHRMRDLQGRLQAAQQTEENAKCQVHFLRGAIDDLNYQLLTWGGDRDGLGTDLNVLAQSPGLREIIHPTPKPQLLGELGPNGEIPGAQRIPEGVYDSGITSSGEGADDLDPTPETS